MCEVWYAWNKGHTWSDLCVWNELVLPYYLHSYQRFETGSSHDDLLLEILPITRDITYSVNIFLGFHLNKRYYYINIIINYWWVLC